MKVKEKLYEFYSANNLGKDGGVHNYVDMVLIGMANLKQQHGNWGVEVEKDLV